MTHDKEDRETQTRPSLECKKPYNVPQLTVHGTVKELTQNLVNGANDGVPLAGSTL